MNADIVKLDASKNDPEADAALMELYRRLVVRGAPRPGSFSALSPEERREYYRLRRRHSRARVRAARDRGDVEPNLSNVRSALADAALMILATGSPGVDQVRLVLGAAFAKRPGVPLQVEQRAKSGKLRPKLIEVAK